LSVLLHVSGICILASSSGQPTTSSTATSTDTSSAAGARAASSTGATAAFPPGDFLQNIIQMAANSGLQSQQGQPGLCFYPFAASDESLVVMLLTSYAAEENISLCINWF